MLQRVVRSCARNCVSRSTATIRLYSAQPAHAPLASFDAVATSYDPSASSSAPTAMEVAGAAPPGFEGDVAAPGEKPKKPRAKRTPKDPSAPKEAKPRKKRTPSDGTSATPKQKEKKPPSEPLKPVEESATYLNWLGTVKSGATSRETVFAEIERMRPAERPRMQARSFPDKYTELVARLSEAFSRDQLHDFCATHSLRMREKKKSDLIESIIEQHWGWPSLSQWEQAKSEITEVVKQAYSLDAPQAFLVLGKDGSDLLQLSSQHHVDVHLEKGRKGLILCARGVRASLETFAAHVEATKKAIVVETFRLPVDRDIPAHLVQRISRISHTFLELVDEPFTIRLHATNNRGIEAAKRLATQAVTSDTYAADTTLLSYLPPNIESKTLVPLNILPPSYSLYPFFSPRSLPWNMPVSAFRVRRVGEWLGHDTSEDPRETGGLVSGRATIADTQQSVVQDLKASVLSGFTEDPDRPVQIHALLGHLLYTNPGQTKVSLTPPLTGAKPMREVMSWANEHKVRPEFVSSLPAVVTDVSGVESRYLRRLTYRAASPTEASGASIGQPYKIITFEVDVTSGAEGESPSEPAQETCVAGLQKDLDVLTPDRPMDIRFVASQLAPITMPPALAFYADNIRALQASDSTAARSDAIPPLKLVYQGDEYHLQQSVNVRQSQETVNLKTGSDYDSIMDSKSITITDLPIIKESRKDSESELATSACQILCDNPASPEGWETFLGRCDQLSTVIYSAPRATMASLLNDSESGPSGPASFEL